MSDAFTRDRLAWLERLTADPGLHSSAVRVAVVIMSSFNRKSGHAWPSVKTIAAKSATPERTVERALSYLCRAGYLDKRRGGFGKSNRYVMTGAPAPEPEAATAATDDQDPVTIPATHGGNDAAIPATHGGSFPPPMADHSRHPWRTNPLIEPIEIEPSEKYIDQTVDPASQPQGKKKGRGRGSEDDSAFVRFWAAYPRKVAKGQARTAWKRAAKLAEAEAIVAGAERYAAERDGQDPNFTKHAATWLRAEGWADEPAPPKPGTVTETGPHRRAGTTAKDRTAAAIAAVLARTGNGYER